jgi:uncharacterized protein with HEPN domain
MPPTPSKSPAAALRDILENIKLARSFFAGMSFTDFQADKRTTYATVRCLEIISEASRRLPPDLKARHPEIPWTDMAGAGSVYRHQYDDVRDEMVWVTVQRDLEPLRIAVAQEIERLAKQ